jgi:hypothetical protein
MLTPEMQKLGQSPFWERAESRTADSAFGEKAAFGVPGVVATACRGSAPWEPGAPGCLAESVERRTSRGGRPPLNTEQQLFGVAAAHHCTPMGCGSSMPVHPATAGAPGVSSQLSLIGDGARDVSPLLHARAACAPLAPSCAVIVLLSALTFCIVRSMLFSFRNGQRVIP